VDAPQPGSAPHILSSARLSDALMPRASSTSTATRGATDAPHLSHGIGVPPLPAHPVEVSHLRVNLGDHLAQGAPRELPPHVGVARRLALHLPQMLQRRLLLLPHQRLGAVIDRVEPLLQLLAPRRVLRQQPTCEVLIQGLGPAQERL
jgi:hypothetical protein